MISLNKQKGDTMKANILLISLIMTQSSIAARTCSTYIPDEWPDSRYTVATISSDNVITDNKSGLMWKQCSEGLSGNDCSKGIATTHTWKQSLDLALSTEYANFSDWRLPNIEELRSISAINCLNPSINEIAFPNTPLDWFWSSTPFPNATAVYMSRVIFFSQGGDSTGYRGSDGHVRLVRSN